MRRTLPYHLRHKVEGAGAHRVVVEAGAEAEAEGQATQVHLKVYQCQYRMLRQRRLHKFNHTS